MPTNWPDPGMWACSPCRAEHTGSVHVTLPWGCVPGGYFLGGPVESEALREGLLCWAKALAAGCAGMLALVGSIGGAPAEEEVANALMGGGPDLELGVGHESIQISGLTRAGARRLVLASPVAEGPVLSDAQLADLLRGTRDGA